MKSVSSPVPESASFARSQLNIWSDLFKARLTFLVLLTTWVGFYVGAPGALDYIQMVHALAGTALLACGASALNQWWERDHDARMPRTETRPLPAGLLHPDAVLLAGGLLSIAGLIYLAVAVNPLTSLLGALTLGSYVFIYTPLKRVTTLNTVIGAVPGALPPLMGWTAAQGEITLGGWSLFAILFFWQLPHFLAIAWLYREDYARAGFAMVSVGDTTGTRTGRQAVSHTLGLLPVSLTPALLGIAGTVYFVGALLLGLGFLICAIQFARQTDRSRARRLFFASILYLPLVMTLMALDKLKH